MPPLQKDFIPLNPTPRKRFEVPGYREQIWVHCCAWREQARHSPAKHNVIPSKGTGDVLRLFLGVILFRYGYRRAFCSRFSAEDRWDGGQGQFPAPPQADLANNSPAPLCFVQAFPCLLSGRLCSPGPLLKKSHCYVGSANEFGNGPYTDPILSYMILKLKIQPSRYFFTGGTQYNHIVLSFKDGSR